MTRSHSPFNLCLVVVMVFCGSRFAAAQETVQDPLLLDDSSLEVVLPSSMAESAGQALAALSRLGLAVAPDSREETTNELRFRASNGTQMVRFILTAITPDSTRVNVLVVRPPEQVVMPGTELVSDVPFARTVVGQISNG